MSSVGERSVYVEIGLITDSVVSFSRFMFHITIQTNQNNICVVYSEMCTCSLVEFISSVVSGIRI